MWIALAINAAMIAVEVVGGLITGSLAVLADAGHVLSDAGSIGLALLAAALASRPSDSRRTFGLQRSEVLAALVNGLLLVAVSVVIAVAAIGRLGDPPSIEGGGRPRCSGVVGLAGNLAATVVLAGGKREDINLEGTLRHSAADALGSLGVIVAGAFVLLGGSALVDPIVCLADRGSGPRLVLALDQGAVRSPDGGGARGGRRRRDRRRDLRGGGSALGPRPPRLDRDPGLRSPLGSRGRRRGERPRPGPAPDRGDAPRAISRSSTRPCRSRRRPPRSCSGSKPPLRASCKRTMVLTAIRNRGCTGVPPALAAEVFG